jgi:multidrug efflux system membrane fusion protein
MSSKPAEPDPASTATVDRPHAPLFSRHRRVWLLAGGLAAAAVTWIVFPLATHGQDTNKNKAPAAATDTRGVPVVAGRTTVGDMPVHLTGLGTVTPLKTVLVKSRVDGQLIKIAFKEGQAVREGDLLAQLDPRPFTVQLEQAEGQLARDQATLENAQKDLQRYQVLVEQNSAPRQQLDTQAATVKQDEGVIKSDQAQIDSAKLNLVYSQITAPVAGRVGLRLVDVGNIVHATDTTGIVTITQVSPITVVFTIPEDSLSQVLPKVRRGTALPVDAFDRDLKAKLASGTLLTTDNQIDTATGTVKLKAQFANTDEELFPNQFVNARVLVDTIHHAVIAPTAAVQRSSQATFVYVIKADSTVDVRKVVAGLTEGDRTVIQRGLQAGEQVVTEGVDKLQQGTRVSVRSNDGDTTDVSSP